MRKRTFIKACLLSAVSMMAGLFTLASPSQSEALIFSAFAQGQAGYVNSHQFNDLGYGAAAGVSVLGIQAFGDFRQFRDGNTWIEGGLGFQLSLPVPIIDVYVRPGLGVIRLTYDAKQVANNDLASDEFWGLNASLLAGVDYQIAPFLYLGVQANGGYQILTDSAKGEYVGIMGVLRAKLF